MIRFSMEIPTAFLKQWTPMTDLDFVLAHKVLEDTEYATFFASRDPFRELILDNSMHELGHPLPISDLVEAAKRCKATFVIPPDKLGEPEWNLRQFRKAQEAFLSSPHKLGAVMCGRSPAERKRQLLSYHGASMLLLPYRENRLLWYLELRDIIHTLFPRIHLLGVNELDELRLFVAASGEETSRWSVDTAKPIKWGMANCFLEDVPSIRGNPLSSKALLNITTADFHQIQTIKRNVAALLSICGGVVES